MAMRFLPWEERGVNLAPCLYSREGCLSGFGKEYSERADGHKTRLLKT